MCRGEFTITDRSITIRQVLLSSSAGPAISIFRPEGKPDGSFELILTLRVSWFS